VGDSAPYSVYVDTPSLIGVAAEEVGFEVKEVWTLRERGLRWKTSGVRHQEKLEERLVWFQKD
jgi:hypothetical protein